MPRRLLLSVSIDPRSFSKILHKRSQSNITLPQAAITVVGCGQKQPVKASPSPVRLRRASSASLAVRTVESGAWRVMRKIESSLRSGGGTEVRGQRIEV